MNRYVLILLIFFGIMNFGDSYAQKSESLMLHPEFVADAQTAIDLAYNREYRASVEYLEEWRNAYPDNPFWTFWPAFSAWWPIIADLQDTRFDDDFIAIINRSIQNTTKILNENPDDVDAMIVQSVSLAFLGRLQSNREQWLRSFRNARRSVNLVDEIEKIAPDHPDINFGKGMLLYFSAFLRDEYLAARAFSFVLPKGDRQKGLELLDTVANDGVFFSPESIYFLGHIYLHYEKNYTASLHYIEELIERYPDNPYYIRLLARTYYRNFRHQDALKIIDESLAKTSSMRNHEHANMREELYYIKGRILQDEEKISEAITSYQQSLEASEGLFNYGHRRFQLMAAFHKGESHLIQKEKQLARKDFEFVAKSNSDLAYVERARNVLKRLN